MAYTKRDRKKRTECQREEEERQSYLFAEFHGRDSVAQKPSNPVISFIHCHLMSSLGKDNGTIHTRIHFSVHIIALKKCI